MISKGTDFKTLQLFIAEGTKHPWSLAGGLMMGPGFVLQNIVSPLFIAKTMGQLAAHHPVSPAYVWLAGASMLSGAAVSYVADHYAAMNLEKRGIRDLYLACFQHLLRQDYSFFANNFSGSLVTRVNRFVNAYNTVYLTFFLDILGRLCGVLVAFGVMIAYNAPIGIVVMLLWLMAISIVGQRALKRMPIRRQAAAKESQQTGELADVMTNAVAIKTFAAEARELTRYSRVNNERTHFISKSWGMAVKNEFWVQVMCGILQLFLLVGGVRAVQSGSISIATFLLFQVYILRIIDSISKTSLIVRQLEGAFGDAHEMTELFGETPQISDPAKPEKVRISRGAIEFKQVRFHYAEQEHNEPLFRGLDLSIKPGERVGLVGPSGGGKSTITRLLLRFHDIQDGSITIDGQNIQHVLQADLHTHITYVPQEPILFHRSLAENIAYGKPHATLDEIKKAAASAHADDFIEQLPEGYDTLVGERGVKLSGGQRQRVAIARAMLKDAPILVLDEATSALDSESEALIQDALWQLMEHKTALVIAHRLSTIQRMDRIIVLDEGKVVEQGTHQQLLKNNGLYARLWKHQSGGFIEE